MIYIIIAIVVFFIMAFFPIAYSLITLRHHSSDKLIIPSLMVDNPKYFTDLYRSAFRLKLQQMSDENIVEYSFKPSEKIVEADKTIEFPIIVNSITYAEKYDFIPPEGLTFNKEIYANKNVYLIGIKTILGIYCKRNLYLGTGIDVVTWVDSDGEITAEDGCSLGIITTSSSRIMLGENCTFSKMMAPQIFLGFTKGSDFRTVTESIINDNDFFTNEVERDIKSVDDDVTDKNHVFNKTIITKYNLTVIDGISVKGDIRSHQSVRIGDNAVVYGNIFAEGDIYLGQGSRVLGSVFTQRNVITEQNVIVGQKGKTKSVVAREKIIFDKCCVVYGYIESLDICQVCLTKVNKEQEDED